MNLIVKLRRGEGPFWGTLKWLARQVLSFHVPVFWLTRPLFALLYLVNQALVYAAEVAAVRHARLWPRALDLSRPTAADARALALLAREQERIPAARVDFHLAAPGSPPTPGGTAPADDGPG